MSLLGNSSFTRANDQYKPWNSFAHIDVINRGRLRQACGNRKPRHANLTDPALRKKDVYLICLHIVPAILASRRGHRTPGVNHARSQGRNLLRHGGIYKVVCGIQLLRGEQEPRRVDPPYASTVLLCFPVRHPRGKDWAGLCENALTALSCDGSR